MSQEFNIGDIASWDYRGKLKTGEVVSVVQPLTRPSGWKGLVVEASSRDHVSYVVKVGAKHYWPRVRDLRKVLAQ